MSNLTLHFEKAGLFSSIQDSGRFGVQHLGIPISGAMDQEAMRHANYLVGNPSTHPVIEMTLQGADIRVEGSGQIALAGGYFKGTWNGQSLPFYKTLKVKDGDLINIEGAIYGCRTYLAVGGSLLEEKWLGSHSAVSIYMEGFGLESHFKNGRAICFKTSELIKKRQIKRAQQPIHSDCAIIRTTTGPDFEHFDLSVIQEFYEKVFTISGDCNRMGYRLNEQLVRFKKETEELSTGIIPGTVQISNDGSPIVLMADAQTTGGYPRIANVVSEDLDLLAQMKQSNEVKFMLISREDL